MAWIYGGIGSDGVAMGDLHALDLASYTLNTAIKVVGASPAARGYAALAPAGLNSLVLVGGRTGSALTSTRAEGDYTITLPACRELSTTGVSSTDCYRGSCNFECQTGFMRTNLPGGPPVTCEVSGYHSGNLPVC